MPSLLNHIGLTVADLDRSVEFYRGVFGFRPVEKFGTIEIRGTWVSQIVGAGDEIVTRMRCTYLDRDGLLLELITYPDFTTSGSVRKDDWRPPATHFAINVKSVVEFYDFSHDSLDFVSAPVEIPDGALRGKSLVYLCDPDGHFIELFDDEIGI